MRILRACAVAAVISAWLLVDLCIAVVHRRQPEWRGGSWGVGDEV